MSDIQLQEVTTSYFIDNLKKENLQKYQIDLLKDQKSQANEQINL